MESRNPAVACSAFRRGVLALAAAMLLAAAASCDPDDSQSRQAPLPAPPTAIPAPTPDAVPPPSGDAPLERGVTGLSGSDGGSTPVPTTKPSLSPESPSSVAPFPVHIAPPPPSDLIALARRFRPGQEARLAEAPVLTAEDVGRTDEFWLIDLTRLRVESVSATLRLVTPHALWYTADANRGRLPQIEALASHFEERVYPVVAQATLGYVPEPSATGIGAPTTMLIAPLSGAAGYFAPSDYYTSGVYPYSNSRPILYLDSNIVRAGLEAFGSLAGHEFQHLLHHQADPVEYTWVNEGIAEVTSGLVARRPNIAPPGFRREVSLTNWPAHTEGLGRHYAAANLFFSYFTQRYGIDDLARLVARPEAGIDGIEAYLQAAGHTETFADVFQDWAVANLLGGRGDMPHGYADASTLALLSPRHTLSPDDVFSDSIAPFAADYVAVDVPQQGGVLHFEGDTLTSILNTTPYSGSACWWSNRGDSSHSRLTRSFDLSQVSSATLRFRIWHNLEELWDYLYVTASEDGGETWQVLAGERTVTEDPLGATYGPGITGQSRGWVEERMDLSAFAGGEALVSFEQVLDTAISLDGACIDDIAVPEAGFFDDAEADGDWSAEGFVRTNNVLRQRFGVRVVIDRGDGDITVSGLTLDETNSGSLRLEPLPPGASVTAIVTSLTRHTTQPRNYTLRLSAGVA